jgi:hypothetical protein
LKKLAAYFFLVFAAIVARGQTVTLLWNYPTNSAAPQGMTDTTLCFVLQQTTNLAQPLSAWIVATNVSVTNLPAPALDATGTNFVYNWTEQLSNTPTFFVVTASNLFGTSIPSNTSMAPPAATSVRQRIVSP